MKQLNFSNIYGKGEKSNLNWGTVKIHEDDWKVSAGLGATYSALLTTYEKNIQLYWNRVNPKSRKRGSFQKNHLRYGK